MLMVGENVLSTAMAQVLPAGSAAGESRGEADHGAADVSRRGRALLGLGAAAALIHLALLGGLPWRWPQAEAPLPTVRVRTLASSPGPVAPEAGAVAAVAAAPPGSVWTVLEQPAGGVAATTKPAPSPRRPSIADGRGGTASRSAAVPDPFAGASLVAVVRPGTSVAAAGSRSAAPAEPRPAAESKPLAAPGPPPAAAPESTLDRDAATAELFASPRPAEAEGGQEIDADAIPLYPTRIAPAATLHYALRRGSQSGTANLRWRPTAAGYVVVLEGSIEGRPFVAQVSEGGFDVAGLAPSRFTEQRLRRQVLATNFQREAGKVSFSASASAFTLQRGSQDRLSLMLQLAAIADAAPQPLAAGAAVAVAVVGVRGEPVVWDFRVAGTEAVGAGEGAVQALKLTRASRGPYDINVTVWLDPQRHHLPVRMLYQTGSEAQTLDLVLQSLELEP